MRWRGRRCARTVAIRRDDVLGRSAAVLGDTWCSSHGARGGTPHSDGFSQIRPCVLAWLLMSTGIAVAFAAQRHGDSRARLGARGDRHRRGPEAAQPLGGGGSSAARCVSHQGRSKFPGATTAEVPAVGEPGTWPGLGGLQLSASGGAGTGPTRTKQLSASGGAGTGPTRAKQLSASGGAGTGPTRAKQRGARRSCGPHSSHPPERYWRGPTQRSLPARPSGWSFRIFSIAVASVATAARVRVRFEGTKIRPACVRPWASRSAARGRKSLTLLVITARSSADAAPRTTLSLLPTRSPRSVTAMTS